MDYLEMIRAVPAHRTALIEDSNCYTYGSIVRDADEIRHQSDLLDPGLEWIDEASVYGQLIQFLAYSGTNKVPVIISRETTRRPIPGSPVPSTACMGVLTSGTTGIPKIWFRTFESWHSFFPTQNHIFGINSSSRMLVHGSLAFTGNLNMYLSLMSEGASAITCSPVYPPAWNQAMVDYQANGVYLIPSKLRLLARTASGCNPYIKTIVSGSQSLGLGDIRLLRTAYPNNQCTLYYGASELSFVSFIRDSQMNDDPACVGLPFPGINIMIKNNEISVDTPYRALGLPTPCSVGDMGYTGADGYLYLLGRKNNVYNIHGRKISASLIEHALMALDEVDEAAVTLEHGALTAYVVLNPQSEGTPAYLLMEQLKQRLNPYELPRRIIYTKELPKNSSGKPVPSLLSAADPH